MAANGELRKTAVDTWREFRANRRAWVALGRNLVPVAGVFAFGWSAGLILLNYWFDGVSAVAAILATIVPRAMRESGTAGGFGVVRKLVTGIFVWGVLMVFVGLPYWIALIPLHDLLLAPGLWTSVAAKPSVWAGLAWVAGSNLWTALGRRYAALPEKEMKQALRWDLYLLVIRALAMFLLAMPSFPLGMVLVMALVMTYLEVFPAGALRAIFGDPDRLWEYDPAGEGEGKTVRDRHLLRSQKRK
jgi:Family of unknown function (DUF6498)